MLMRVSYGSDGSDETAGRRQQAAGSGQQVKRTTDDRRQTTECRFRISDFGLHIWDLA
jgi:hypothetical protein